MAETHYAKRPEIESFYDALYSSKRDVESQKVKGAMMKLCATYINADVRKSTSNYFDGDWLMESAPSFSNKKGYNENGDAVYLMGRMTFNMIQPGSILCSIQKTTQHVHKLSKYPSNIDEEGKIILPPFIPTKLLEEVNAKSDEVRTFTTCIYFTVEEEEYKGLKGMIRMEGYMIQNSDDGNNFDVWFTGGKCFALKGQNVDKWKALFGTKSPDLSYMEQFQLWIAKIIMGAEPSTGLLEDDSLSFSMKKPIAGSQKVTYLDETTRITVGNRGTIVVTSRMKNSDLLEN